MVQHCVKYGSIPSSSGNLLYGILFDDVKVIHTKKNNEHSFTQGKPNDVSKELKKGLKSKANETS